MAAGGRFCPSLTKMSRRGGTKVAKRQIRTETLHQRRVKHRLLHGGWVAHLVKQETTKKSGAVTSVCCIHPHDHGDHLESRGEQ